MTIKKTILVSVLMINSFSAFAFHSVSEILPSGKILICQDFNQLKKGNTVEIYDRYRKDTDRDVKMMKVREMTLPKVGEKIKLTHSDFHQVGTSSVTEYHSEEAGSATILESSALLGEKRFVRKAPNEYKDTDFNQTYTLEKKDVEEIEKKCLVAMPDKMTKELHKVSW